VTGDSSSLLGQTKLTRPVANTTAKGRILTSTIKSERLQSELIFKATQFLQFQLQFFAFCSRNSETDSGIQNAKNIQLCPQTRVGVSATDRF